MSIKPSLLRVFYKATEQRIKVFEGTTQSSILDIIKRSFHIDDDISKIFLQDEDGDFIVLPPKIPNGLCAYVYVEPSLTPKIKPLIQNNKALKTLISNPSNSIPPPPNPISDKSPNEPILHRPNSAKIPPNAPTFHQLNAPTF